MSEQRPVASQNVARRYLWAALVAALIPLIVIASLYDRYSANLLRNLIDNRVEANLEATSAKMSNFMAVQVNRLENIVDLPEVTAFFTSGGQAQLSDLLTDLLLLEVENPDIYAIELTDVNHQVLRSFPATRPRETIADLQTLPWVQHGAAGVLGPVMPTPSRPGWFLVSMPVTVDHQQVGIVSLRLRLASLTEQAGALVEPGVFTPQIVVFDRIRLTPAGTAAHPHDVLAQSRQFFPGWRIHLVDIGGAYKDPKTYIRYLLLVAALLSIVTLMYLFHQMSEKLTRHLHPLTEGARAIANGNFSVSVAEDGPGELGTLARSYNRMRLQLGRLIQSRVDVERRAALGSMAAGIAHEIRNPLTTVAATVHGLRHGEADQDRRAMFDVMTAEIERVDDTIDAFLNYARPSPPEKEWIAIRDEFRGVKTLINTTAESKGVTATLSGESGLRLLIDPSHCRQILLNLALNAVQAMPEGGTLILRAHREGGAVVLTVSDSGIGMAPDLMDKILRPFFTTKSAGHGLGLSVTNQLVEANGGRMQIESSEGAGTAISLVFPLTPDATDPGANPPQEEGQDD